MKKLLIILSAIGLISCTAEDLKKKEYTFAVTYFNGDLDTVKRIDIGRNTYVLNEGDLRNYHNGYVLVSIVRKFNVVSIKELK